MIVLKAKTANEIEAAFAKLSQQAVDALVVTGGAFASIQNDQIVALAAQHRIPTVFHYRQSALAGGLMSYGADPVDGWRLMGNYAGRILKGEKPADLPVQQATKILFSINMKTAKALGLTIPPNLLAVADEVIERRREFIAGLGGTVAWPLAARAQQGERIRRIGGLVPYDENDPKAKARISAFTQALADLGWTDRNVEMDIRWGGGDASRMRALAHELVGLKPDIIATNTSPATVAVQREMQTIPIVFASVSDPVAQRIVPRLDRRGNYHRLRRPRRSLAGRQIP
jgi:ABC-type uncharacterized transport system substrate-binding protein